MPTRVTVSSRILAPSRTVVEALPRGGVPTDDGPVIRWTAKTGLLDELTVTALVSPDGDATDLRLSGTFVQRVPYFNWLFRPLLRRHARDHLRHTCEGVRARGLGRPPPIAPPIPVWAPPAPMTTAQVRAIATLCFVLALAGYGGSLMTHTIDHFARTFDATNADLGALTAFTRVGTLAALVGTALADRMGRRRIILLGIAVVCLVSFLSAFAPSLASFAVLQIVVRGGSNLVGVVAFIAVLEEAPERARAYTLAISGVAASLGFALGAILLPVADVHPQAWRSMYAAAGLGLLFLPGVSKRLLETRRFLEVRARHVPRGHPTAVARHGFGSRFVVVALTGFLLNMFFAPSSQFMNRYLIDERGFSGFGVLTLRATTQTVTALVAVWVGGRLAESWGRKPAAIWGVLVMAVTGALFFAAGGPILWIALAVWTAAGGFASPSLSAFNTELFPTQARGTAGAGLLGVAVAGSVVGLLVAGGLAERLGGVGLAVAVTAGAPFAVAVILIPLLPEARGADLDVISPPDR